MQKNTLQNLEKMIEGFKGAHFVKAETEQTFMQITGYPHYENVHSNILAFFFNIKETHNFGRLFIQSLLECIGADTKCRSTETIKREMPTDKGNFIDIFIETDKYLIAIENKIFSGVNNPLADYETHITQLSEINEKTPKFILLTLKEENPGKSEFVNVTYSMLFEVIKKNIGTYLIGANTKWIVMLNDFIRTIENLQEETVLDREFIEFYNKNEADIDTLIKAVKALPKSLNAKLQSIVDLICIEKHLLQGQFTFYNNDNRNAEYYLTYKELKQVDASVHLVIHIDTKSCDIIIGIDDATIDQLKLLKKVLSDYGVKFSRWDKNTDYFLLKKICAYDDNYEDNEKIAREFQRFFNIALET